MPITSSADWQQSRAPEIWGTRFSGPLLVAGWPGSGSSPGRHLRAVPNPREANKVHRQGKRATKPQRT